MTDETRDARAATDRLHLADWRRRVAELYAEVRATAATDPAAARAAWAAEREALYRDHPSSPVPAAGAGDVPGAPLAVRRPACGSRSPSSPAPAASGLGGLAGLDPAEQRRRRARLRPDRLGAAAAPRRRRRRCRCSGCAATPAACSCRSAMRPTATRPTARAATSSTRRKGADLGGDPATGTLVVDLNFAFQPSCAFDPKWACPLAPPENRLAARIEAGERLR